MHNKISKIDKVKITVELNKELYQVIRLLAVTSGITIRRLIGDALHRVYIEKSGKP